MTRIRTALPYLLIALAVLIIVRALDYEVGQATRGGYYD